MDLRIFTEPQQGASYDDLLAVAQATESAGFSAFFRSDHYLKMGDVSGLPGPTHAWLTLAGLARETKTIRLGTLVSPITFYDPGSLAIMVAQVDQMSGGRVDFGIGAGWYEAEHSATGLPFPSLGGRMDRLEEALEQIVGLWSTPVGDTFTNKGTFATFTDSPALPKPVQSPIPIIIGGKGKRRTPAMVAKFGAEFNVPFGSNEEMKTLRNGVRVACEAVDRDPAEITYSVALAVCGGSNEAEVNRRAAAIGRESDELRTSGICGTAEEIIDRIGSFAEVGAERMYLQVLDLSDLDHIAFLGSEVLPALV